MAPRQQAGVAGPMRHPLPAAECVTSRESLPRGWRPGPRVEWGTLGSHGGLHTAFSQAVCRHVIVVTAIPFLFRGRLWRPVQ